MDEDRLQREIEEQRERDQEEGRQRAVKHRRRRERAERSCSETRSNPPQTRGPSVEDFLQPAAAEEYRESSASSLVHQTVPSFQCEYNRHSEPADLGGVEYFNTLNYRSQPLPSISRAQFPYLDYPSFNDTYFTPVLGSFQGTGLTPLRSTNFPSSANRDQGPALDHDLLRRIHIDSGIEYRWPLSGRSQSTPIEQHHSMWVSGADYDTQQLRRLLEDCDKTPSYSALGQTATSSSMNRERWDENYSLRPEKEVQCKILCMIDKVTDCQIPIANKKSLVQTFT